MNNAELPFLSAAALGELIHKKEISPVQAVTAYLERIAAVDDTLHCYITVCREEALQAAREAEQAILRGECLWSKTGL
jgi:aspartyl-tRNA(Asn)/glutamyl-tRNA(Gln) amidotransferase subunit A